MDTLEYFDKEYFDKEFTAEFITDHGIDPETFFQDHSGESFLAETVLFWLGY